jgi:hypothetical protein
MIKEPLQGVMSKTRPVNVRHNTFVHLCNAHMQVPILEQIKSRAPEAGAAGTAAVSRLPDTEVVELVAAGVGPPMAELL